MNDEIEKLFEGFIREITSKGYQLSLKVSPDRAIGLVLTYILTCPHGKRMGRGIGLKDEKGILRSMDVIMDSVRKTIIRYETEICKIPDHQIDPYER